MNASHITALLLSLLLLAGCNPIKSTAEAEKAASEFHALFNARNYEKIYDDAHPDFKATQPKADLVAFLRTIREKMGAVKSTTKTGWQASSVNLKTNANLAYSTQFENGKGSETFIYRIADGKASLIGWHVNSPVLISNPSPPPSESSAPQP